jgi:hypothetical protein
MLRGRDRNEATSPRMRRASFVAQFIEQHDEPIDDAVRTEMGAAIGADDEPNRHRGLGQALQGASKALGLGID